ncbi:hypothetical protein JNW90_13235 [Micromonospora sp. STR1s_5]|nr:hypothetical protein [Micromonospora sp. STR1s_5]
MNHGPVRALGSTGQYLAIVMFLIAWAGFGIIGTHSYAASRLFMTGMAVAAALMLLLALLT